MTQGTTSFPTALDTARVNPSNMDSSEAALLAMQARMGVVTQYLTDGAIAPATACALPRPPLTPMS